MQTVEEMKAKQAADLAKLEAEHAIASGLPLPPKFVMLVSTGEKAWVTYYVADLWEALETMAKFEPLAMYKFKGTYTRYEPEAINDARKKDKGESDGVPLVAKIVTSGGEGHGPNAALEFFAYVGGDICKIKCDLHGRYGRNASGYGPRFVQAANGRSRVLDGPRYLRGDFRANDKLAAMACGYTMWGTGCDKAWQFTYALAADYANADYSAGWHDAGLVLENLAAALHGEKAKCIRSESYVDDRVGGGGKLLTMADGSVWFHPYSGGAPVCEVTSKESGE